MILGHLGVGQTLASVGVLAILHNGHAHLHQGFQGVMSHTANAIAIGFLDEAFTDRDGTFAIVDAITQGVLGSVSHGLYLSGL